MKTVEYEKIDNSAASVTDRVKIQASEEDMASLRDALGVVSKFENFVLAEFQSRRGYAANDTRHSDNFKEIHFWFRDGFVMASIRTGSVG